MSFNNNKTTNLDDYRYILGVIQHTPTVTLDGTAFVTFTIKNYTWVQDFYKINPNGFPLPAGETNTVTLIVNLTNGLSITYSSFVGRILQ